MSDRAGGSGAVEEGRDSKDKQKFGAPVPAGLARLVSPFLGALGAFHPPKFLCFLSIPENDQDCDPGTGKATAIVPQVRVIARVVPSNMDGARSLPMPLVPSHAPFSSNSCPARLPSQHTMRFNFQLPLFLAQYLPRTA
jgi:hypothetical protein